MECIMTDGKKKDKTAPPRNREMQVLNWLPVLQEMDSGDARAAALVATSLLENNLVMAIISRLRSLSDDQRKELFDKDTSPIGTFHAKILLGFALNLFDERINTTARIFGRLRAAAARCRA
jgi:hypothetical protein